MLKEIQNSDQNINLIDKKLWVKYKINIKIFQNLKVKVTL